MIKRLLAILLFVPTILHVFSEAAMEDELHAALVGSRVMVQVQTNVHRFYYQSEILEGKIQHQLSAQLATLHLEEMTVRVPVHSLQSGNAKRDRDLMHMVQSEKYPWIILSTNNAVVSTSHQHLQLNGELYMAGKSNPITVNGHIVDPYTYPVLEGELHLDLRDFDVEPPRPFGGLVKVDPKVHIKFRVRL